MPLLPSVIMLALCPTWGGGCGPGGRLHTWGVVLDGAGSGLLPLIGWHSEMRDDIIGLTQFHTFNQVGGGCDIQSLLLVTGEDEVGSPGIMVFVDGAAVCTICPIRTLISFRQ